MAGLSLNPLSQLVNQASSSIQASIASAQSQAPAIGDALGKLNLDNVVNQASGGLGSGLNGLTGNITSGLGNLTTLAGTSIPGASAFGGIASTVQSSVGGAINSLQSVAANTSNITSDISGSIGKLTGGNLAGGLMSIAGSISSAAGMLNNLLSLTRGKNLPAGGELALKQSPAIKLNPNNPNDWRVRINANWPIFQGNAWFALLDRSGGVVWPYTPTITVSTKAEYTTVQPTHSNYNYMSYKNSTVDDIQISGEFSCETETDAAYWIAATMFFKTATKMFFGSGDNAGNPPIVCNLSGYGSHIFDNVPVVIKSFSVDLKDDVNYINCGINGANTWVPTSSTITVTVTPVYNRRRLRQFNLNDYAKGRVAGSPGVGYI
jgi:hypothetical protein